MYPEAAPLYRQLCHNWFCSHHMCTLPLPLSYIIVPCVYKFKSIISNAIQQNSPGRSAISKNPLPHELLAPTLLFPSIFGGKSTKIAYIATSPTSCHSVAITTNGDAYGWGRNETGQLGLGYTSAVVPLPTKLSIGDDDSIKFVGAGVGKYHTILVGSNGLAYGSGGNLCGQLGINNMGSKGIDKFRKCVVMGQISGDDDEDGEGSGAGGNVKIVQVSLLLLYFCRRYIARPHLLHQYQYYQHSFT